MPAACAVVTDAEERERTVYWRDYPGIAGVDPHKILQGPTPGEGLAAGKAMIAEVRAALTAELQLEWAPPPPPGGRGLSRSPA